MATQIIRFADFELDLGRYQVGRGDHVVKLEKTPMELLILLVEKTGGVGNPRGNHSAAVGR
jgi:DNA-binding winged helix-turn-helix (wHTH) protein